MYQGGGRGWRTGKEQKKKLREIFDKRPRNTGGRGKGVARLESVGVGQHLFLRMFQRTRVLIDSIHRRAARQPDKQITIDARINLLESINPSLIITSD